MAAMKAPSREFKADPALMGSYAMVRLTGARATVLLGELVES